jgi:glucose-1-phosphate adenylyltransferase
MDNCEIGRHCVIRNAILDKNVVVREGTQIGVDLVEDRARGFKVTDRRHRDRSQRLSLLG